MSPKASELHSSKLHSWGTEPRQGPDAASLLGGTDEILNLTEFIKPSIRAVICPVYSSSLSHIHLWFPSLPSVKPVWHLPAASSALRLIRTYLAHKRRASSRKRSYCKYDNSIRCCNQLCRWVTRARAPTQKYLRSAFGEKVRKSSQF